VSGPLFEQYKEALRRGHVAATEGRLEEALEAYREAARVVPERSLPYASQGMVLHRLDRWSEATAAFDEALRRSPDDEATLRARAAALEERGQASSAAGDYERLAFVLDVAGQAGQASAAARRAAELEPSPARTALVERLQRSLAQPVESTVPTGTEGTAEMVETSEGAEGAVPAGGADWPAIDMPSPPPAAAAGPTPDVETVMANATSLLDAGDTSAARDLMLMAVLLHRSAGRLDAALDICFQLLAFAPGDPQVHLAIANLQLDQGWTPLAKEKIDLLGRFAELIGDTQAAADAHGLAGERLRDRPVGSGAGN
jgi:tetratricopeptide (TPR) repeat protein